VRVHEELAAANIHIPYTTLTGFCRRHGIGVKEKKRVGRYPFEPGQEMQHDTSPHRVQIGDRQRKLQCASLILCYSRLLYAQAYPTFNRFYAKVFLTNALRYFGGSAQQCMVDNTSVIVAHGTGKDAVVAPEMAAFAKRFGFAFQAHELGNVNRSARVERSFHYIENNFYAGRHFSDLKDLNRQFVLWCDKVNRTFRKQLSASPIELFQAERAELVPLPVHIPEVYQVHERMVDVEGYVCVHTNRYSVDTQWIGRRVQVHETQDVIRIFVGHRLVEEHERLEEGSRRRVMLPRHRHDGRYRTQSQPSPSPEEKVLRAAGTKLGALLDQLKKLHRGRALRAIRHLHRMYLEYPTEAVLEAVDRAVTYGLSDLDRIEHMILSNIAGNYFRLDTHPSEEDPDESRGD
jgi:hypothetical protein